MKKLAACSTVTTLMILMMPVLTRAQPANPGTDPFATPVNGGVAFVAVIAFLYGAYRIHQLVKKSGVGNTKP